MDAITEFLAQKFPGTEVNEFIVGGGSKVETTHDKNSFIMEK